MRRPSITLQGLLVALILFAAASLTAVETTVWQVGTFNDFLKGELNGVAVTENGELGLAPQSKIVFSPEEALVLSLAAGDEHQIFLGTGHQGKVFRIDSGGKASLFFTAQEPDIFALAVGPNGDLYAGSSPEGKIYRITPQGQSSVFYDPRAKYIWALLFDPQGNLYVGTGDQGEILKVSPKGEGSVFYSTNQTHIMCLAFDPKGNLLAGSVPDGLIYRISPQGRGFVIYQAGLPEIHSITVDQEGRIFAAALGTGQARGVPAILHPPTPIIQAPAEVMTVTVTGSSGTVKEEKSREKNPNPPQTQKKTSQKAPSFIRPQSATTAPSFLAQKSRGEVLEILPDSTAQTLWRSEKASAYGLVLHGDKVIFSTDSNGDIYELNPADDGQNLRLIAETKESVVSRLLLADGGLYMATSNVAKLFRLEFKPRHTGTYQSAVEDTKFISRWGHLTWRGEFPAGSGVDFYTRAGNSDRPDATWSDWAGPLTNPDGSRITSPPARYIQWKAVFHGSDSADPLLDEVSVSFLNQNLPPQIHSLNVSTSNERTNAAGEANPSASSSSSIAAALAAAGAVNVSPVSSASAKPSPTPLTITWQADDPNNDTLVYSIYAKAADERAWHLLKKGLKEPSYTIEPHTLPDGKYQAKVVATDEASNPPSLARTAEMVSAPFWVDNTAPSVEVLRQETEGAKTILVFQAEDTTSPIVSAEYSLDGGEWKDILSDTGIVDSTTENFSVRLSELKPGEHVVILRAYDSGGNAGVGKAVVEIPNPGAQNSQNGARRTP